MPTLLAHIMEGHTAAGKARLIAALTNAVVEALGAPLDSVCVLLDELPRAHFGIGRAALVSHH